MPGIPTDSTQLIPHRRRRKGRRGRRRRRRERTRRRGVERKDAQAVESPAAPSSGGSSRVVLGLVSGHFRREQRLSDVLVVDLVLVLHVHVHHVTRKDVLVHGLLTDGGGGTDVVVLGLRFRRRGRGGGGRRKRKWPTRGVAGGAGSDAAGGGFRVRRVPSLCVCRRVPAPSCSVPTPDNFISKDLFMYLFIYLFI